MVQQLAYTHNSCIHAHIQCHRDASFEIKVEILSELSVIILGQATPLSIAG